MFQLFTMSIDRNEQEFALILLLELTQCEIDERRYQDVDEFLAELDREDEALVESRLKSVSLAVRVNLDDLLPISLTHRALACDAYAARWM